MSAARQVAKSLFSAVLPSRMLLARGPNAGWAGFDVALTFDDGPHPEHTPRLLDRLAERGIAATFFVIGSLAERFPAIVRRIAAEGHEIGNHSYKHAAPARTSARAFIEEVRRTRDVIEGITAMPCRRVRPPLGDVTLAKAVALWEQEQTIVLWNVDPRDYRATLPSSVARWSSAYRPCPGDIVLMHDCYPHAAMAVEAFGGIAARGDVRFVRVSEWISDARQAEARTGTRSRTATEAAFGATARA